MKNILFVILAAILFTTVSCNKRNGSQPTTEAAKKDAHLSNLSRETGLNKHDICLDSANYKILSYRAIEGITYADSLDDNTLTYDAGPIREYLSNPSITKVRIAFAYENGHKTAIIYCTNGDNKVVLNPRNMMLEHSDQWCPMCKCCASAINLDGTIKPEGIAAN